MKRVFILLTLCVFLSSCVSSSPLGRYSNALQVPENVVPLSVVFALRDTSDWIGASGVVKMGDKKTDVLIIYRNSKFNRIVRFPKFYESSGNRLELDSSKLIRQALAMPAIELNKLSAYSFKEYDSGREPWNIAPAVIVLAPFFIGDVVDRRKDTIIPLGTSVSNLPGSKWVEVFGALVNHRRQTAVKVRNGVVYEMVKYQFFDCQYGAF